LSIGHLENVVVEIEHIIFCQGMVMSLLNEIISDFDDIVVKVNMTVDQGVTSRFKSSDQSRLSDEFFKNSFVIIQIKQLKYLFLKPFLSFIPNFCHDE